MNRSALAIALTRFLEANQRIDRDRILRQLARAYKKSLAEWFANQGQAVLKALEPVAYVFDVNAAAMSESVRPLREISPAEWEYLVDGVMMSEQAAFVEFASEVTFAALMAGYTDLVDGIGDIGLSFALENPRATAYAQQHAAALVRQINDTTRGYLRTMIGNAVRDGMSWTRLSDEISYRFQEFSVERADRIARHEMRNAYEAGNETAARDMKAAGLKMEKSWLSIGDEKVRPSHRDNQAQGWIPLDDAFGSGDDRPPTDPGCRCVLLYRRAK